MKHKHERWLVNACLALVLILLVGGLIFLYDDPAKREGSYYAFDSAPVYIDNEPAAGQIAGQETPAIQSVCEEALGYDAAGWVAGTPPTIVCHNETHTGYVPMPEGIQAQENITVAQATVSG